VTALIVLVLLLLLLGGGGFALGLHILWWLLIAALVLWAIGFVVRGAEGRWYRW
jgi:hypothetical protein